MKGLLFATRPKRRVGAFALSFAFLSALTFISISLAEQSWTVDLRRDTAVWITQRDWETARTSDADDVLAALGDVEPVDKIVRVRYVNYRDMHVFGVDVSSPWASEFINPGKVLEGGRFIRARKGEALTAGFFRCTDGSLRVSPAQGSRLTLMAGEEEKELKVVGELSVKGHSKPCVVLSQDDFESVAPQRGAVYVHEIVLLARGSATLPSLFGNPYDNVAQIRDRLRQKAAALSERYWQRPASGAETGGKSVSAARLAMLVVGVLGGFLVSLTYGYTISRFRMREAAVLKAIGYSSWQVGLMLVAEVVLVAGVGCFAGLAGVRAYFLRALPSFVSTPALLTLLVVFFLNVLGFFLVAMKAASVQPMALFRQKG